MSIFNKNVCIFTIFYFNQENFWIAPTFIQQLTSPKLATYSFNGSLPFANFSAVTFENVRALRRINDTAPELKQYFPQTQQNIQIQADLYDNLSPYPSPFPGGPQQAFYLLRRIIALMAEEEGFQRATASSLNILTEVVQAFFKRIGQSLCEQERKNKLIHGFLSKKAENNINLIDSNRKLQDINGAQQSTLILSGCGALKNYFSGQIKQIVEIIDNKDSYIVPDQQYTYRNMKFPLFPLHYKLCEKQHKQNNIQYYLPHVWIIKPINEQINDKSEENNNKDIIENNIDDIQQQLQPYGPPFGSLLQYLNTILKQEGSDNHNIKGLLQALEGRNTSLGIESLAAYSGILPNKKYLHESVIPINEEYFQTQPNPNDGRMVLKRKALEQILIKLKREGSDLMKRRQKLHSKNQIKDLRNVNLNPLLISDNEIQET